MDAIESDTDDLVCTLPTRVVYLGEALKPVADKLHQAMMRRVRPDSREFETMADMSRHMGLLEQALTHLSAKLEDLTDNVFQNEIADMTDAYRAAGRLEQVLSEFVDGYHEVQSMSGGPESGEARKLLLGVYRHHIRDISVWLDELVHTIANPAQAIKTGGIIPTPHTMLSVNLNMTRPPEMAQLEALVKELQIPPESSEEQPPADDPPQAQSPGLLNSLGALVFGLGVSQAVLGRHHHD